MNPSQCQVTVQKVHDSVQLIMNIID